MKSASNYVYGGEWVLGDDHRLKDTTPPRRVKNLLRVRLTKDPLTFILDSSVLGFFILIVMLAALTLV